MDNLILLEVPRESISEEKAQRDLISSLEVKYLQGVILKTRDSRWHPLHQLSLFQLFVFEVVTMLKLRMKDPISSTLAAMTSENKNILVGTVCLQHSKPVATKPVSPFHHHQWYYCRPELS